MGLDSTMRKSAIKKAKESAFAARRFEKRKHFSTDVVTVSIIKRVDEGTKVCSKCEYFRKNGKRNNKKHDLTCTKVRGYKTSALYSMEARRVIRVAKENMKINTKKLTSSEKGGSNPVTREDGIAFFASKKSKQAAVGDDDNDDDNGDVINDDNDDIAYCMPAKVHMSISPPLKIPTSNGLSDELLLAESIKTEVNIRVRNPTKSMKQATHLPVQVAAILDYLISLLIYFWY
jgi:hypothetical protein